VVAFTFPRFCSGGTVELGLRSGRIHEIPCVAGAATHCPDGSQCSNLV